MPRRFLWLLLLVAIALPGCIIQDTQPPGFSSTWQRMQRERAAALPRGPG